VVWNIKAYYGRAVESATRHIALTARSSKIIVEKSTVPCRTAHSMRAVLEANASPGVHFDILSNPEFLAEVTSLVQWGTDNREVRSMICFTRIAC
jgi:UDP-glucose 6-dehydrogenase